MDSRILAALNAKVELTRMEHLEVLARRVSRARKFGYAASVLLVKEIQDDGVTTFYTLHLSIEVEGYEPELCWLPWEHETLEIIEDMLHPDIVVTTDNGSHRE